MLKRNLGNKKTAFTLIEMLIYIAIIGIVISGFVSYSLSVSGVHNKNYSVVTVQANGRTVLEILSQSIHKAQAVLSPASFATSSYLILDMPGASPNITFSVSNGTLFMAEGNVSTTTVTDSQVSVSNLIFTHRAISTERANIQIDLTIDYRIPVEDKQFGYSKSYRTAVSSRI
jgi:prepilin-type N-terminal cleavage/methylation domain-containing protein